MLGVMIDEKLNFEEHMAKLVKKVRQAQGAIRRVSRQVPKNLGCVILNAVLVAKMTYSAFLFLSNKKHLKKMQRMLNESIRFVARKRISEKVNMRELAKQMKIPNLKKIYYRQTFMEMIKMGDKREKIFVKASQKTRDFAQDKLRNYGKRQIVKKSSIAKMVCLWNGNVKEINGTKLMQIKKYAKKKFI